MKTILLLLLSILPLMSAEPTAVREWTSSVGSKIEGQAVGFSGGQVTLKSTTGRSIKLPLAELSLEDQALILDHFKPEPIKGASFDAPTLDQPLGKIVGPIKASGNSSYFLYLPTTLADGENAPLLFYTGSATANKKTLSRFISASELTGIVLAASVESKNLKSGSSSTFQVNNKHTITCLKHIEETLPVEVKRVFFTGGSGGGASAFYNASKLDCLGALPYIGYIPSGHKPNRKGFYYIAGGAWDFNRYSSAAAAKEFKTRATHRMYPGGHTKGKPGIAEEGLIWLYTRHIYEQQKLHPEEVARFEARFSAFLIKLSKKDSALAYFWTDHLLNLCEVSGPMRTFAEGIHATLAQDEANVKYLAGRVALDNFSEAILAPVDRDTLSETGYTSPEIKAEAQKLVDEYSDTPVIKEITKELLKKVH